MSKIIQDVNLGINLKKFRRLRNLTQEQVCAKMSIHGRPIQQSTYTNIERGKRNVYVSDLIVLARILDVSIDQLFEGLEPINRYDMKK